MERGSVVKNIYVCILVSFAFLSGTAEAAVVNSTALSVEGEQDGVSSLGPSAQYYGAGVVFEVHEDLESVAMSIDLICLNDPCSGEVFLTRNDVINGISIASLEDGALFSGGGEQTFFGAGLDLVAGIYSLSISCREGFGGWWGTTVPDFQGDGRVSYIRDGFMETFDNGFPPQASWIENAVYDTGITITADKYVPPVTHVPLPAGSVLLLTGLALLGLRRRLS